MATINPVQIAVNRYAPAGSDAINLYSTEGAAKLTLGQLVQATCLQAAAAYEAQSVLKMNTMTSDSVILGDAATMLSAIVDVNGSLDWAEAKMFLIDTMGIPASSLPQDISTYDRRMQAAEALKSKMDALTKSQQEDMVDLQTLVNRRDVSHSTASNVVRALATSSSANAANF